jgi:hypothetical protein
MHQSFDPMKKSPLLSPNAKLGLALVAKTNRPSFKVPSLDHSDSDSDSENVDEEQERSSGSFTPAQEDSEATPLISTTAEESPTVGHRIVPLLKDDICEQFGIGQNGSCVRHPNINIYNFEDGSIDICRICRSENHSQSRQRRSMAFSILEVQDLHLSPKWKKWHDKVNWVSDGTDTNSEHASEEMGAPIKEE